jgi:hypothetical protein
MSLDIYVYIQATDQHDPEDIEQHAKVDESGEKVPLVEVYWANITHNLNQMASAAGIYQVLWRPGYEYTPITPEVCQQLEEGLAKLKADPEEYKKYNAPNGWGLYQHFVPFVEGVLEAVKSAPNGWIFRSV